MNRKPRIDKGGRKSALQRLKELPWDAIEQIAGEAQDWPGKQLVARIKQQHGIGISEQRLSDFWRWVSLQREMRAANAEVEHIREIFAASVPEASAEATHNFLVKFLTARGFAERDNRVLRFVTIEERKRAEGERESRRLRLLEAREEAAREAVEDGSLSDAEKARRIREIFKK
jgi:hypothetical protein